MHFVVPEPFSFWFYLNEECQCHPVLLRQTVFIQVYYTICFNIYISRFYKHYNLVATPYDFLIDCGDFFLGRGKSAYRLMFFLFFLLFFFLFFFLPINNTTEDHQIELKTNKQTTTTTTTTTTRKKTRKEIRL